MTSFKNPLQAYKKGRVTGAQPVDLLIMTYDTAIWGCAKGDPVLTIQALSLLKESLDFRIEENVAATFFRIYTYCGDLICDGKFEKTAEILTVLRDTWSQVRSRNPENNAP